jgi:hypothetical protein
VLITLEKGKKNKCIYKEKIYQGGNFHLLSCKFDSQDLANISSSMKKYNEVFRKQIAKNYIFSAKMTSNGEIFQTYLANPQYCEITNSKQSLIVK